MQTCKHNHGQKIKNLAEKAVMDISVIIVNWNVRDFLRKCLGSLYNFTRDAQFEAIVVDNASTDGSADMVAAEFPQVRLIRNSSNLGFAAANNIGLKEAKGSLVLFLNPDTEITDNAPGKMAAFMYAHPGASAIGCRLVYPDGLLQHTTRHFPSVFTDLMAKMYLEWSFPKSGLFNYYHMGLWGHDRLREVDVPFGACLLVRKDVLERLGGMDERFFMYYDEIDLCHRIKKGGGKIYFVPDITVIHHANKSSDQAPQGDCAAWKVRSKLEFFRKHYGPAGIAGLVFNIMLQRALVYGPVSWRHFFTGRPKNLAEIKDYIAFEWREYRNFIRKG